MQPFSNHSATWQIIYIYAKMVTACVHAYMNKYYGTSILWYFYTTGTSILWYFGDLLVYLHVYQMFFEC